jgi:hypothetical protein
MREYQSNSHRSKTEPQANEATREKRVPKVVSGKAKTRENNGRKLANIFISEDAANVKSFVFMDVFVPMIKKAIVEAGIGALEMIVYGETGGKRGGRSRSTDRVSYRKYYDDRDDRDSRRSERREPRSNFNYDDILFDSRGEAEQVLDEMHHTIKRYGIVTVADMYDMADLTAPYTSSNYGWSSVRNAEVKRVKDGYIIDLPKAAPID